MNIDINELTYFGNFDRDEETKWRSLDRATQIRFPQNPYGEENLLYADKPTGGWYLEAVVTRYLHNKGYDVWHELYKLVDYRKEKGVRSKNTQSMRGLLGSRRHDALCNEFSTRPFSDPDVIGYHVSLDRWAFIEVKRDKESFGPHQVDSLSALKRHFTDAVVAVVRLSPGAREEIHIPGLD